MRIIISLLLLVSSSLFAAPRFIIGIAGGTGSGKTTLAQTLLDEFHEHAVLIPQDAYYRDLSHLTKPERDKVNFDHPDALNFDLLKEHLLALRSGRPVDVPVYNFRLHTPEPYCNTVEPADLIIIEGILLFSVPEIRELCDVKIFVETDDDIRLLRRMERDIHERGRDFNSVCTQYLTTVKPMHDMFVEPSKKYADIILPTRSHNPQGLGLIISFIKEHLRSMADE
jgi:uridine kinase